MDKKDIYEHLAKIYLDASSKKKKKNKRYHKFFRNSVLLVSALIFGISGFIYLSYRKNRPFASEIALVLLSDAAKINFHFDPAKKEIYSLDLNKQNLTRFNALGFSVKKVNYRDNISLRVEFINSFKEKSEVYFKDIPHKWQDYKINLSDFKSINNWSEMKTLCFIIEEWNTKEKKGVVYIDNVRLLR